MAPPPAFASVRKCKNDICDKSQPNAATNAATNAVAASSAVENLNDFAPRYSVTGLTSGSQATLSLEGCEIGARCIFAYSLNGAGPTQTAWGLIDLSPPIKQAPPAYAGSNGIASLQVTVPPGISGVPIWTQAAAVSSIGPLFSNSLALVVQ